LRAHFRSKTFEQNGLDALQAKLSTDGTNFRLSAAENILVAATAGVVNV
jgi:hypothetical protein